MAELKILKQRQPTRSLKERVDDYEEAVIREALKHAKGHVKAAAQSLGTPWRTIYDRIKAHGIDPHAYRDVTHIAHDDVGQKEK